MPTAKERKLIRFKKTSNEYALWLKRNPNSSHKEMYDQFDLMADDLYFADREERKVKSVNTKKVLKRI